MGRVDVHIAAVRRKLTLVLCVQWLARCALVMAAASLAIVLLSKFLTIRLPMLWPAAAAGVALVLSIALSLIQRPAPQAVAVEIDKRLGLKERFSTALVVRGWDDPFARAAAYEAEQVAGGVRPLRQFRVPFPRAGYGAIVLGLLAMLAVALPSFRRPKTTLAAKPPAASTAETKKAAEKALEKIDQLPRKVQDDPKIQAARTKLQQVKDIKEADSQDAIRKMMEALSNVDNAIQQQGRDQQQWQKDDAMMRSLQPDPAQQGPVADAHQQLSQGNYDQAARDLQRAMEQFNNMTPEQQRAAAEQMRKLAEQLQARANDQRPMQDLADKLRQMQATPEQIQRMQDLMQKIAAGDQQLMQQLQQLQQQLAQQMNNGQGANQRQLEQLLQALQQGQLDMNARIDLRDLELISVELADGMANFDPNDKDKLLLLVKDMQGQLAKFDERAKEAMLLDATKGDLQGMLADAAAQCNGDLSPPIPGAGGGGGQAFGRRADPREASFAVKKERSASQLNTGGRFLARQFIQGRALKGESQMQVRKIIESSEAEAGEDVDDSRADPRSREVQRQYFSKLREEARRGE